MSMADMTVAELIEVLQDADPDCNVRIAYQPTYPLRATVATVALPDEMDGSEGFVWIAASASVPYMENPYAPSDAWEVR